MRGRNDAPADAAEPRATIYVPAWLDARDRLEWVQDEDVRTLLASAMEQIESGWDAVRALQQWAEQHPEPERADDDYGALLTFAESEVQDAYRELASDLSEWVRAWPGRDLPPGNDVASGLSAFGRYATVLVLATGAALDVPEAFRQVVHQVARLRPGGEWSRRLAETLAGIEDVACGEITADTARQAVEFLLHGIPEEERDRASAQLAVNLEALYAITGPLPPEWLRLLQAYISEQAQEDETHP